MRNLPSSYLCSSVWNYLFFPVAAFKIFCLSLILLIWLWCVVMFFFMFLVFGVHLASWISGFIVFIKFGFFSDIIQFFNLRHCSIHLLKMDWVFFIFFVFLLHMFNLPSSFLNILNSFNGFKTCASVIICIKFISFSINWFFSLKIAFSCLFACLLNARNCEFYLVGCWIFCYSYICIHILCSERLSYFAKITYPFDSCFQALLLWTRKTFNLH